MQLWTPSPRVNPPEPPWACSTTAPHPTRDTVRPAMPRHGSRDSPKRAKTCKVTKEGCEDDTRRFPAQGHSNPVRDETPEPLVPATRLKMVPYTPLIFEVEPWGTGCDWRLSDFRSVMHSYVVVWSTKSTPPPRKAKRTQRYLHPNSPKPTMNIHEAPLQRDFLHLPAHWYPKRGENIKSNVTSKGAICPLHPLL